MEINQHKTYRIMEEVKDWGFKTIDEIIGKKFYLAIPKQKVVEVRIKDITIGEREDDSRFFANVHYGDPRYSTLISSVVIKDDENTEKANVCFFAPTKEKAVLAFINGKPHKDNLSIFLTQYFCYDKGRVLDKLAGHKVYRYTSTDNAQEVPVTDCGYWSYSIAEDSVIGHSDKDKTNARVYNEMEQVPYLGDIEVVSLRD